MGNDKGFSPRSRGLKAAAAMGYSRSSLAAAACGPFGSVTVRASSSGPRAEAHGYDSGVLPSRRAAARKPSWFARTSASESPPNFSSSAFATSKATTASSTTLAALIALMSLRSQPASVGFIVVRSTLASGLPSVLIGFIAPRTTIGWPLVMPPSMPPAWFVDLVKPSDGVPRWAGSKLISSWTCEPGRRAASKPRPISTPLNAWMPTTAAARRLSSRAFHQALDDDAIELSFSADRDNLQGRMKTLSRNTARAFELLALAVGAARIDPEATERVRAQVLASLRRESNDPDHAAARLFRLHSYPDHPYGRPTKGDLAILPTITRDDILAMRGRVMARDALRIAVVGAIDAAALGREIDRVFAGLPARADLQPVADVAMAGVGECHVTAIDLPQSTIRFGRAGLRRDDPDYVAATVVNHCLGGGAFTARLYKEVREKRGLCYSVYAQNADLDHSAMMVGATSTKNERAREAIDVIRGEIDAIARGGVGEEELDKARKYLIGSYALRFDTSRKIAGHLCSLQLDGYGVDRLDERNALIAAVTVEDAARAAGRLYGDGGLLITVAGRPVGL